MARLWGALVKGQLVPVCMGLSARKFGWSTPTDERDNILVREEGALYDFAELLSQFASFSDLLLN